MKVYEFVSLRNVLFGPLARSEADNEVNEKIKEFTHNGYIVHSYSSNIVHVSGYDMRHVDILFVKDDMSVATHPEA